LVESLLYDDLRPSLSVSALCLPFHFGVKGVSGFESSCRTKGVCGLKISTSMGSGLKSNSFTSGHDGLRYGIPVFGLCTSWYQACTLPSSWYSTTARPSLYCSSPLVQNSRNVYPL
jgi:hypothetical protein